MKGSDRIVREFNLELAKEVEEQAGKELRTEIVLASNTRADMEDYWKHIGQAE